MSKAIGIRVQEMHGHDDPGASKFFGAPAVPEAWQDDFYESDLFFCQIRLADIAPFDADNRLSHNGYLYIFLDVTDGEYHLRPIVRVFDGQPTVVLEDFNSEVPCFERFTKPFRMTFYETEEHESGTRLFGVPSDWSYAQPPDQLLMQYDPLDNDMGFLDSVDGYLYVFASSDLSEVSLRLEYS